MSSTTPFGDQEVRQLGRVPGRARQVVIRGARPARADSTTFAIHATDPPDKRAKVAGHGTSHGGADPRRRDRRGGVGLNTDSWSRPSPGSAVGEGGRRG